ncbi:MAG: hypothetical protein QM660_12980 [Dysgonomonas sp.]
MDSFLSNIVPVLGILCCIGLPIFMGMYIAIKSISTKHTERMELIRQGIVPTDQTKPIPNKYRSLRNGILCIGIALGLIIGYIVILSTGADEDSGVLIIGSSVLFFLGAAYVLFFFVTRDIKGVDNEIE